MQPQSDAMFTTTSWSMVCAVGQALSPLQRREALERLFQKYRPAIYSYIRADGHPRDRAEDLTQDFILRLLGDGTLDVFDRRDARFRTFLKHCLLNHLANARRDQNTLKRGGQTRIGSFDVDATEAALASQFARLSDNPEHRLNQLLARQLVTLAKEGVARRLAESGRSHLLPVLRMTANQDIDYDTLCRDLGMTPEAARKAAQRLRGELRDAIRQETLDLVSDESQVDDELQHLLACR